MTDWNSLVTLSILALAAIGLTSGAGLRAWNGWLEIRRLELARRDLGAPSAAGRIELADLKERVRKLEAIAAGVDP